MSDYTSKHSASLRELLKAAKRVTDPDNRCGDLEYFLNGAEAPDGDEAEDLRELDWYECEVPIEAFGCQFTPDELFGKRTPDDSMLKHEEERETRLLAWVKSVGGFDTALNISPVVATYNGKYIFFVDGWHRSKLAKLDGRKTVRTVFGVRPDFAW